ncbi:MlaC/ttg2D family ABC transporter substrate-binding protein [Piscinibacter sp.]|uniref:MlaC/ttg2D family ABC transporter substrate-binding protein n=1 Tax=Piscinibacter sp. TaxID=1903157 RepID=UPI002CFE3D63|nr:ABC transporter substrate-binding protein [Albitalea sp.]HUG23245.1 ABC transporter substrate-binding protein [Albitalea sp.]
MLSRRIALLLSTTMLAFSVGMVRAQPQAPDELIKQVSTDVLETLKADKSVKSGDLQKIIALVDEKVMPHVNFQRMTASAVGRFWRQATPEQKHRLQDEFKVLLVRTYSGALVQVKDQTVQLKPMRSRPDDKEVVVKTEVRGQGDPIQLDYRLEKAGDGWRIYDVNVLGIWLVENYRNSFAQEIGANGIDGLISKLAERNKSNRS